MAINKVVYGGNTLIDLTADTAVASDVLSGKTFHDKSGASVTGTCTFDADTKDATVNASEMLQGKTAYKNGSKVTGSMPNRGGVTGTISSKDEEYTIQNGYHDGSGKVGVSSTEKAKIIPGNIKEGVVLLGVTGTCSPASEITAQAKEITPLASWSADQVVLPDEDYDYLSQVTVKKIPYVETENTAGGITVTIGAA